MDVHGTNKESLKPPAWCSPEEKHLAFPSSAALHCFQKSLPRECFFAADQHVTQVTETKGLRREKHSQTSQHQMLARE